MFKKLLLITLFNCTMLSAMDGESKKIITTPQQLIMAYVPPLQKMSDCAQRADETAYWFITQEEKEAFKKEIADTQLYKDMLKNPHLYAQHAQELFQGINEYSVSALDVCCKAVPVRDLALSAFFDTDGCCQLHHLSIGNSILGTVFICNAIAQFRRNKKALQGIVTSWQKKQILVEMLRDLDDKKNK